VRLPGRRHGLVGQPDLLHGGHETDRRHPDAAPLLGHQHAEQAERAHLAQEVGGTAGLVPGGGGAPGDLVLREVAAQIDQLAFRLVQREVHGPSLWTDRYNDEVDSPRALRP